MAAQLGVTETEAVDLSIDDIAREHGWTAGIGLRPNDVDDELLIRACNPEAVRQVARALTAGCPPWCTTNHAHALEADVEAMMQTRVHARTVATLDRDGERVGQVDIIAVDDLETGQRSPAEVVVAECRDSYTAAEAEQLAAALLQAARLVRDAR
ncbi:DUF6907 domain-containing protein [Micromonospora sp. NPDC004336]